MLFQFLLIYFLDMNSSSSNTSLFFIALCLSLMVMSSIWILYAYLNPHTRSGQMLIRVSEFLTNFNKFYIMYIFKLILNIIFSINQFFDTILLCRMCGIIVFLS